MLQIRPYTTGSSKEQGAAMVEAAIVLPLFLAIMLISLRALIVCYHFLQFQHEVSEITRQAFVLNSSQRGNLTWQNYLVNQINSRASQIGLFTQTPASQAIVQFSNCSVADWSCSATATMGDIFSITINITEPVINNGSLAGISWQNIPLSTKSIAFVQQPESE